MMSTEHIEVKLEERSAVLPIGIKSDECIRLLAYEAAALHFPGCEKALVESAINRELVESTYLGHGLAVPHARVEGLSAAMVYVAHGAGIPWPNEPADCVALLCVPAERPELHLQLLSKVVRWRLKGGELNI